APARNAFLPEVRMTPVTAASFSMRPMASRKGAVNCSLSTFMERPGMSRVRVTTPLASFSNLTAVMVGSGNRESGMENRESGLRSGRAGSRQTRPDSPCPALGALHALDDGGDAHAGTDAQGGETGLLVLALQLVEQGAED